MTSMNLKIFYLKNKICKQITIISIIVLIVIRINNLKISHDPKKKTENQRKLRRIRYDILIITLLIRKTNPTTNQVVKS